MSALMTEGEVAELRDEIIAALEGSRPPVHEVELEDGIDEATGDDLLFVGLTLADPDKGMDTWDLDELDSIALKIELIAGERDLPTPVVSFAPISVEEYAEDSPAKS